MSATFQLSKKDDSYTFNLVDDKGETLLIGGNFENREILEKNIKDVRVASLMSQLIAAGKVPTGESFFVIKNNAGEIIAKSGLFDNQMIFDSALHKVKDNACVAEIVEA